MNHNANLLAIVLCALFMVSSCTTLQFEQFDAKVQDGVEFAKTKHAYQILTSCEKNINQNKIFKAISDINQFESNKYNELPDSELNLRYVVLKTTAFSKASSEVVAGLTTVIDQTGNTDRSQQHVMQVLEQQTDVDLVVRLARNEAQKGNLANSTLLYGYAWDDMRKNDVKPKDIWFIEEYFKVETKKAPKQKTPRYQELKTALQEVNLEISREFVAVASKPTIIQSTQPTQSMQVPEVKKAPKKTLKEISSILRLADYKSQPQQKGWLYNSSDQLIKISLEGTETAISRISLEMHAARNSSLAETSKATELLLALITGLTGSKEWNLEKIKQGIAFNDPSAVFPKTASGYNLVYTFNGRTANILYVEVTQ